MPFLFKTFDGSDQLQIEDEQVDKIMYISIYAAMLLRRNIEIATGCISDDYDYPTKQLIDELVDDEHGHTLHSLDLEQMLRSDELPDAQVNFAAFPDRITELPYDEIVGKMQGVLHGAYALFMNDNQDGYYSPGQVLDISQFLGFTGMEEQEIGNVELRLLYIEFRKFFQTAAARQEAVLFSSSE